LGKSENKTVVLSLYAVLACLMLIHHWYYRKDIHSSLYKYFLISELCIGFTLQYFDNTPFSGCYIFILLVDGFRYRSKRFVTKYAVGVFSGYIIMLFFKSNAANFYEFWVQNAIIVLPRTFILALIIISKHALEVSRENKQLAKTLQEKNMELKQALDQITAYTHELGKMAQLRAREALMDELHDKLGHTLTTVSVVAQAANVLVDTDTAAAKSKLEIVTKQIQDAMLSLRDLISGTSHVDEEELSYTENLLMLIDETQKHTGITINHNIDDTSADWLNGLSVYTQSFIYNALMEGITNGMRHGLATIFTFELLSTEGIIYFFLRDNGRGFEALNLGHGLSKMHRDARRLGAGLELSGKDGCALKITIPIESI
jgi:signal transduction histidine kinase